MSATAAELKASPPPDGAAVNAPAQYRPEARRSGRLPLAIPVELQVRDASGETLRECTRTLFLSKHGASLRTRRQHAAGAEVEVRIPHLERVHKAQVIWSVPDRNDGVGYETAIGLAEGENFWGVQFPPDDWAASRAK